MKLVLVCFLALVSIPAFAEGGLHSWFAPSARPLGSGLDFQMDAPSDPAPAPAPLPAPAVAANTVYDTLASAFAAGGPVTDLSVRVSGRCAWDLYKDKLLPGLLVLVGPAQAGLGGPLFPDLSQVKVDPIATDSDSPDFFDAQSDENKKKTDAFVAAPDFTLHGPVTTIGGAVVEMGDITNPTAFGFKSLRLQYSVKKYSDWYVLRADQEGVQLSGVSIKNTGYCYYFKKL